MLAPSGELLRAGMALKLNHLKRAARSYLRDRTSQTTGRLTSYAVAAGLFAVAGLFLIAIFVLMMLLSVTARLMPSGMPMTSVML